MRFFCKEKKPDKISNRDKAKMAIIKSVQGQFYSDNVMRIVRLTNSIVFVNLGSGFILCRKICVKLKKLQLCVLLSSVKI